jgi:hypothetical protein
VQAPKYEGTLRELRGCVQRDEFEDVDREVVERGRDSRQDYPIQFGQRYGAAAHGSVCRRGKPGIDDVNGYQIC